MHARLIRLSELHVSRECIVKVCGKGKGGEWSTELWDGGITTSPLGCTLHACMQGAAGYREQNQKHIELQLAVALCDHVGEACIQLAHINTARSHWSHRPKVQDKLLQRIQ